MTRADRAWILGVGLLSAGLAIVGAAQEPATALFGFAFMLFGVGAMIRGTR